MEGPDTREAIRHQLDSHRELVALDLADFLLPLLHARQDAELVLDVVAHLVRDYVRIGEVAARAEPALHLLEERQIDVDLLIERTIERPHGRLRAAAAR